MFNHYDSLSKLTNSYKKYNYMITLHPQFIKDTAGNNLVIIPQKEFDDLLDELEDIEDIRLYDEAKKTNEDFIPIDEAFKTIEAKRKHG